MSQLLYTRGNESHWGSSWSGCLNSCLILLGALILKGSGGRWDQQDGRLGIIQVCCRGPAKPQGQQLTTSCFSNMPRLHLQRDQT